MTAESPPTPFKKNNNKKWSVIWYSLQMQILFKERTSECIFYKHNSREKERPRVKVHFIHHHHQTQSLMRPGTMKMSTKQRHLSFSQPRPRMPLKNCTHMTSAKSHQRYRPLPLARSGNLRLAMSSSSSHNRPFPLSFVTTW